MSGDGSIEYRSHDTSHFTSYRCNDDGISDEKSIEVSLGDVRRRHRSLETSHYSSRNRGGYHSSDGGRGGSRSQETRHTLSKNVGFYNFRVDCRGGTRSQETRHSLSPNCGEIFDVEGRGEYRSQTSHYSLRFSGGWGGFSGFSFTYCPVYKYFYEDKIVGYSDNISEKGDISCDHGDGRRNITCDDGNLGGDIRVDYGRRAYRSKETSHIYSHNIGENVGGYCRGIYRSQTIHSSSHNPYEHGRLLRINGASIHVDDSLHENERGNSRGYGTRRGSRYQDTSHSYFQNGIESVYGDERIGYRSQTSPCPSNHSYDIGRSLGLYSCGHDRGGYGSHTSQFYLYNHGRLYISHPRLPQEAIPGGLKGENTHQKHPYYSYSSMSSHPHHNMKPHSYPIIPPHPIYLCTYCKSTTMHAPYVVYHHPHIPSLGYLHRTPSRIHPSMLPNLLPL